MLHVRHFSRSSSRWLPRAQGAQEPQTKTHAKANKGSHHDLASFHEYAESSGLSTKSTFYVGTLYEYTVLEALKSMGLTLSRVGGASDKGIDLQGDWQLPSLPEGYPLKVIVQCKALARKSGPSVIRELEGAFNSMPQTLQALDKDLAKQPAEKESPADNTDRNRYGSPAPNAMTMGLLATPLEATKAVRDAMGRSRLAIGFARVSQRGVVEQLLWNHAAAERGLGGVGVTVQYTPEPKGGRGGVVEQVKLTWNNKLWPAQS